MAASSVTPQPDRRLQHRRRVYARRASRRRFLRNGAFHAWAFLVGSVLGVGIVLAVLGTIVIGREIVTALMGAH